MIAGRIWIPRLGWALVTLAITLILGRVWCGWICPLGTTLDWIRFPGAYHRSVKVDPEWRKVKYILLLAILGMALLGNLTLLIIDPITLLTRAASTGLLPALNLAFTQLQASLYQVPVFQPVVNWLEGLLRGGIRPAKPGRGGPADQKPVSTLREFPVRSPFQNAGAERGGSEPEPSHIRVFRGQNDRCLGIEHR